MDYPRTELLETVVLPMQLGLDPNPYFAANRRPIPGPTFAAKELELLFGAVDNPELVTPTAVQLGRIAIHPEKGCWELGVYIDKRRRARYGSLQVKGIEDPGNLAHRVMYRVFYGAESIPPGQGNHVDHICQNTACCYPRHLEVVTQAVNTLRGRIRQDSGQFMLDFD